MLEEVEFLTVMAAAAYLGISRDKLSRLIRAGKLKALENPLDSRQRLIARRELDALRPPGRVITRNPTKDVRITEN